MNSDSRPLRVSLTALGLLAMLTLAACNAGALAREFRTDSDTAAAAERPGETAVHPGSTEPGDAGPGTSEPNSGDGQGTDGAKPKPDDVPPVACEACDPIDPDDPVTGTPDPAEPPPPTDGATHVEPQPGVRDAIPYAIDHISVAADGVTVTVYWWGGVETCYGLKEVRVEQDDDGTLSLTVLEGTLPDLGDDVACIDIALLKATTITLDEPLFEDGSAS